MKTKASNKKSSEGNSQNQKPEEATAGKTIIHVGLKNKIYAFTDGRVLELPQDIMGIAWRMLMYDQFNDETKKPEKGEVETKAKRAALGMKLMAAYTKKDSFSRYSYEKGSYEEEEIEKLIINRAKDQVDGAVYEQIRLYLTGRENPLESLYEEEGTYEYTIKKSAIEEMKVASNSVELLAKSLYKVLSILTPFQIEATPGIALYFNNTR
jgi:hypothetical protein